MKSVPPLKLSILREIGWNDWDPIGLQAGGGREHSQAADEYDLYLLHVAGRLQNGEADSQLVDYLVSIEAEHMGLGASTTAKARAQATVAALRRYVESLF